MNITLDATAWFAYFNGSSEGAVVRDYLGQARTVHTAASTLAEVAEVARRRRENAPDFIAYIESKSQIVPITSDIALRAGRLMARRGPKMRIRDAFVVAVAQAMGSRVLSLNPLLEGLEDIVPLG